MSITNTAPQDYNDSYNQHPQRLLKLMDKTDESRNLVQKARAMCSDGEIAFLEQQLAMFSSSPREVKRVSRRTNSDLDISERSRVKSISFDVSVSSPKNLVRPGNKNDSRQSLGSRRAPPMQPSTSTHAKELNFYCEDDYMSTSVTSKRSRSQTFDVPSSSRGSLSRSHDSQDYYSLNQTRESCNYADEEEVTRSSPSKRYRSYTFDVSNSSRERSADYDFRDCSSCNSFNCRKKVSMDHLNSSTQSEFALKETNSRSRTSRNLPRPVNRFCAEERSIAAVSNTGTSYNNLSSTYEESYEPYFGQEVLDDDELSLLSFASAL